MNNNTRAAVAYIAARLITKSEANSVYDYKGRKYFNISGEVLPSNVNVYEYASRCYISGSGNKDSYSLYHYGNKKHIDLNIKVDQFDGYDYASKKHFSGS